MKNGIIKALISQFLVYLLGALNPEQKAEVDALFAKREEQAKLDEVNKAESDQIEERVKGREEIMKQDDAQIEQNDAAIQKARDDLKVELDGINKTESIEEVWKR